jgi:hypothetical protein
MAGIIVSDVNDEVSVTASSSRIAETLIDNQSTILAGTYLMLLGVFFLIIFLGYLRAFLLAATDEKSWLVSVAFGGGLVACAMLLLAAHFSQAFTVLESYGGETQVAKALYLLEWNWYLLVEAPPLAALVGATTAIGFRTRALPWWLNGWGTLLTLALLSPILPGSGVMLTFLWVVTLSVVLLLRTRGATGQETRGM